MTERKPGNVSFPDWVEAQISEAERRGAFADLPGKGKPIPGIERPAHEMDWIVGKLRRENVDIASVLPPALALAKEVELLRERLVRERSAQRVRELVEDLNTRIRVAQRAPQDGPPFRVRTVDVDASMDQWRADRAVVEAAAREAAREVAPSGDPPALARRRWWTRRRRAS